ncbi:uncharacterized protein LOC119402661 [Rhipicephalus sanguineus]|uniref:uncharacterized protein LOC119402661 n=1 Tax=Rhipicephalus sanguineus TaxID=34632 RepID=UPI0020C3E0D0|nr:uncharacterized protein LOC119402661 [Rhipicephalus sanguineus]
MQIDMLKRNFPPPGGEESVCVSTTTDEIYEKKCEVTQKIKFMPYRGAGYSTFYQRYWVGRNNKTIQTTPFTTLPHAKYELLASGSNCAVVSVTFIGDSADTTTSHSDGAKGTQCVLWVMHKDVRKPDECCKKYFETECTTGTPEEVYSPDECDTGSRIVSV